jgi:ribonuclease E/ribonuclease G
VKIDRIIPGVGAFVSMGNRSGLFRDSKRQSGDSVIAQVKSIRAEGKADIVTDDVALGGQYFVCLPHGEKIRVSRKVDPDQAAPLLAALEAAQITSGILRTGALKTPVGDVVAEAKALQAKWQILVQSTGGGMLQNGPNAAERLMQDYPQLSLTPRADDFEALGLIDQIETLRQPQMKLPSGGSIVIERTAALTAIDVNAGTSPPATADREALALIAAQLRLRNLSGLIVIDFTAKEKPDTLLESVRRAIIDDPAGPRVAGISPAGLIEIIRPGRDLPLAEKLSTL